MSFLSIQSKRVQSKKWPACGGLFSGGDKRRMKWQEACGILLYAAAPGVPACLLSCNLVNLNFFFYFLFFPISGSGVVEMCIWDAAGRDCSCRRTGLEI